MKDAIVCSASLLISGPDSVEKAERVFDPFFTTRKQDMGSLSILYHLLILGELLAGFVHVVDDVLPSEWR